MRRACRFGVNKRTGRCLKTKRHRKSVTGKRRCKHGVSKKGGRCLKRARRA